MQTVQLQATAAEIGPDEYVVAATHASDVATTRRLDSLVSQLLDAGAAVMVLDLRSLSLVDGAALGVVMRVARDVHERGGRLVLASDSADVLAALHATGVDRFVTVRPTLTRAIDAVRDGAA